MLGNAIVTKAEKSYVDGKVSTINSAIALKADKSYVDTEITSLRESIDESITTEIDRTYVDNEINKLNTSLQNIINTTKESVMHEININTVSINDLDTTKAEKSEIENLNSSIENITTKLTPIIDGTGNTYEATLGDRSISTHGLMPGATIEMSPSAYPNLSTPIRLKVGQIIEVSSYTAILVDQGGSRALCIDYGANISYKATGNNDIYIYSEIFPIDYVIRGMSKLEQLEARIAALEAK